MKHKGKYQQMSSNRLMFNRLTFSTLFIKLLLLSRFIVQCFACFEENLCFK